MLEHRGPWPWFFLSRNGYSNCAILSDIASAFTDVSNKQHDETTGQPSSSVDAMCLEDRMSHWFQTTTQGLEEDDGDGGVLRYGDPEENEEDNSADEIADDIVEDKGDHAFLDSLLAYRQFIFNTEAYRWLLARVRKESYLISTEPNIIGAIRERILSSLPSNHRISRKVSSQIYSARFEVDWDIFAFFEMQEYESQPEEALEGIITLTGSLIDAQAATCAQYIRQTWPLTGEVVLKLVKEVVKSEEDIPHHCKCLVPTGDNNIIFNASIEGQLPDGSSLCVLIIESTFIAEGTGVANSIAEIGEIIAWIAAALRIPSSQSELCCCTPVITNVARRGTTPYLSRLPPQPHDILCKIGFEIDDRRQAPNAVNGQCWHAIFNNPVVVKGYPIPDRAKWGTGLEIPLNVLAGLARTCRIDTFNHKLYIKGFSTMLVPTTRDKDILCWHLIFNKDGNRISYLDDFLDQEQPVGHLDLESVRHVVGWCSEAKLYAGENTCPGPVVKIVLLMYIA